MKKTTIILIGMLISLGTLYAGVTNKNMTCSGSNCYIKTFTVDYSWYNNLWYVSAAKTSVVTTASGYSCAKLEWCNGGYVTTTSETDAPYLVLFIVYPTTQQRSITFNLNDGKSRTFNFPPNGEYTVTTSKTSVSGYKFVGMSDGSSFRSMYYDGTYKLSPWNSATDTKITIEDGADGLPYITVYWKDIYLYNSNGSACGYSSYNREETSLTCHIGSRKPAVVTTAVTLNKQDGTGGSNSVTATNGQAMPFATMPTRTGYTFNGYFDATTGGTKYYDANGSSARNWDKSSSTAILYAQWSPNTNTAYTVKHYKQQLDGTYSATPDETDNLTGTTATNVTPAVKSYTGFTAPAAQTVSILADGSRVVTYQYTRNTYTLTWNLAGGTITTAGTAAGEVLYEAPISAPTVERVGYTFAGWDSDIAATMSAAPLTYTASWNKATTLDLYDNRDATYYNNIKALNGQTYDVTYHRSVAYTSDNGNARWYTICLPFNVDRSQLENSGLLRKVYEYRYAEGSADPGKQVTFHFRVATSMVAGQGYLVKATGDMGPNFTFTGVTLNTSADVVNGNVDNLKNSNAYKESGDIAIVGVLRSGTLSNDDRKVMGLANNKIWYPHSSGNPMPAYRAYFYNPDASDAVMPRVRIVVEGEGTTELEVVDGELYDASNGFDADGDVHAPRKYIRNGVLIIERNGVRYDAQGKRL